MFIQYMCLYNNAYRICVVRRFGMLTVKQSVHVSFACARERQVINGIENSVKG